MKPKKQIKKIEGKSGPHIKLPDQKDLDTNKDVPFFSFLHLQSGHCVKSCEADDQVAFAQKLQELGSLTWAEIIGSGRHGLGKEKIPACQIQKSIPIGVPKDKLIALRFSGKKPMVGFREGRVFHILWLDHKWDVYKHS
jgi:hypothetical protein